MPGCARCQGLREESESPCPPGAQPEPQPEIIDFIYDSGFYLFIYFSLGLWNKNFPSFCQYIPIFRNLCPFSEASLAPDSSTSCLKILIMLSIIHIGRQSRSLSLKRDQAGGSDGQREQGSWAPCNAQVPVLPLRKLLDVGSHVVRLIHGR